MIQMQKFTGLQYLQIDIASNFGLDKKTWDERLTWFEEHKDRLLDMLPQAAEPALYYAGVKAWDAVMNLEPIGYPISLDATSSGLQLLAILIGDRSAAELCNVVDMGDRMDAYTAIYEVMLTAIGEDSKISRDDVKRAIMTSLYGSKAVPKEVFGKGELYQIFINTMKTTAPAAWELNEEFVAMWDPDALSNDWTLPDNFHVHVKVMGLVEENVLFLNQPFSVARRVNMPMESGRSLGANMVHSIDGFIVREMGRRCNYDPDWIYLVRKLLNDEMTLRFDPEESQEAHRMVGILWKHYEDSGYLSARILEYLDSDTLCLVNPQPIRELIDSLPAKPFNIIMIHDCFRCLPTYGNDLREQYNRQLYLIAKSEMLSFLLSALLKRPVTIGKLNQSLADDILETEYALS
jgi:hypothetical protein